MKIFFIDLATFQGLLAFFLKFSELEPLEAMDQNRVESVPQAHRQCLCQKHRL